MIKLGVLGSTKGTDLEKIIETEKLGQLNATISVIISNRKNAYILERAKTYNIPSVYISHKNKTRNAFDSEVSNVLDKYQIDLILLIGFVAIMYFLIIRPQNKRLKAQKEMIDSLAVGDEVIASGGMVCVITKMNDDFLTVRANDTVLTIQRESVSNVLPKGTIKSL